jgi:N-acetylglucosaminyldiphosphoundecaprenol N-acetyl-beta-D-mannosaminyltransferase
MVGGIRTASMSRAQLARQMVEDCMANRAGLFQTARVVIASNGSVIARYHGDETFRSVIDQADIVDADGMPLVIASRLICEMPLIERVATTDFIEDAAAAAAAAGLNFYFLGGNVGVAEEAARRLQERHPKLKIVGARDGYFRDDEFDEICAHLSACGTDVLWLGLGSPRQEEVALKFRNRLTGLGWIRTCGGLFDHMSGSVRRAPALMQAIGLEWLHRLLMEPRRLAWRYIRTNPVALFHLLTKTMDDDRGMGSDPVATPAKIPT